MFQMKAGMQSGTKGQPEDYINLEGKEKAVCRPNLQQPSAMSLVFLYHLTKKEKLFKGLPFLTSKGLQGQ